MSLSPPREGRADCSKGWIPQVHRNYRVHWPPTYRVLPPHLPYLCSGFAWYTEKKKGLKTKDLAQSRLSDSQGAWSHESLNFSEPDFPLLRMETLIPPCHRIVLGSRELTHIDEVCHCRVGAESQPLLFITSWHTLSTPAERLLPGPPPHPSFNTLSPFSSHLSFLHSLRPSLRSYSSRKSSSITIQPPKPLPYTPPGSFLRTPKLFSPHLAFNYIFLL